MLRVLMFGWEFPPFNSGGLGTACLGLSRALVDADVSVTFVLPKRVGVAEPGVKIVFADVETLDFPTYGDAGLYGWGLLEEVKKYAAAGGAIAAGEEFDVIHAHDWLSFGAGIAAKRASGKPLVVHVHATEFDRTGGNGVNQAVYEMERQGMEAADAVVAVSEYTKSIIVAQYGIDPDKVTVVYNGVQEASEWSGHEMLLPLSVFKRAGKKIVLFLGRITLQKGPDYFLRAAKRVLEFYPNVLFVMAGTGDMSNRMVREAAALGISDKVLFAGFVRGDELGDLYRVADLFVMPSVSEPFGIAPLESITHGTPVLISKQSGVSEVLASCLKTDFWDVDDMTNKIVSVLYHDSLQKTLTEQGAEEVRGITWRRAADKLIALYQRFFG